MSGQSSNWLQSTFGEFEAMFSVVGNFVQQETEYLGVQFQAVGDDLKQFCTDFVRQVFPQSMTNSVNCMEKKSEEPTKDQRSDLSLQLNSKADQSERKQVKLENFDKIARKQKGALVLAANQIPDEDQRGEGQHQLDMRDTHGPKQKDDNVLATSPVFESIGYSCSDNEDSTDVESPQKVKFDKTCILTYGSDSSLVPRVKSQKKLKKHKEAASMEKEVGLQQEASSALQDETLEFDWEII